MARTCGRDSIVESLIAIRANKSENAECQHSLVGNTEEQSEIKRSRISSKTANDNVCLR